MEICIEKLPTKNVEKLTPKMVRRLLGIDNKEIADLCRQISLIPKKDTKGQTYFSKEDVEVLKRIKTLHSASVAKAETAKIVNYPTTPKQLDNAPVDITSRAPKELMVAMTNIENKLVNKISQVIDEKLDGMDEVVVELIRCKTENETLRQKINELNKEAYRLRNENGSYKPIGLNFYVKKPVE